MATLQRLSQQKLQIESELDSCIEALKSQGADMNTPLLVDGFPRSDIDIPQIRLIRAQIIRLRNDLASTMEALAEEVKKEFQTGSLRGSTNGGSIKPINATTETEPQPQQNVAFAYIRQVFDDSPASQAGLREGDHIVQFGGANALNHNKLTKLATIVRDQAEIEVHVKRPDPAGEADVQELIVLTLKPDAAWGGRGALGCRIVPL